MQQKLYDDVPYIVTYYASNHEAYRSDRFQGFVPQPAKDGTLIYQWGSWSYQGVTPYVAPATPDGASTSDQSSSKTPLIVGALVGVVVVVLVFLFLMRRRSAVAGVASDDKE